jgi:hypothetical protein
MAGCKFLRLKGLTCKILTTKGLRDVLQTLGLWNQGVTGHKSRKILILNGFNHRRAHWLSVLISGVDD